MLFPTSRPLPGRRLARCARLLTPVALAMILLPSGPAAAAPAISVSPSSNLAAGQTITVSGTEFPDGLYAVTMCGNADSAGTLLAGQPPTTSCFGIESMGAGQLKLVTIAGGAFSVDYVFQTSGIGVDGATCVTSDAGCVLVIADAATQGATTTAFAVVRVPAPVVTTPPTTDGSGTTVPSATTIAPATTLAPAPGTTVARPPVTTARPVTATTLAAGGPSLVTTGPQHALLIGVFAAIVLDIGWLLWSAARPGRRRPS